MIIRDTKYDTYECLEVEAKVYHAEMLAWIESRYDKRRSLYLNDLLWIYEDAIARLQDKINREMSNLREAYE